MTGVAIQLSQGTAKVRYSGSRTGLRLLRLFSAATLTFAGVLPDVGQGLGHRTE